MTADTERVNGRKRDVLVDSGGLVLRAKVHTSDIHDRAAVIHPSKRGSAW
jgi:hypothetical protein